MKGFVIELRGVRGKKRLADLASVTYDELRPAICSAAIDIFKAMYAANPTQSLGRGFSSLTLVIA